MRKLVKYVKQSSEFTNTSVFFIGEPVLQQLQTDHCKKIDRVLCQQNQNKFAMFYVCYR